MTQAVSVPYLDTLIKLAKQNYPRRKIYAKQVDIAQNNVNRIKLSWLDGLGLYYIYIPAGVISIDSVRGNNPPITTKSKTSTVPFQFGFSLNIGSLFSKPAQINALKGQREVSRLEQDEYELNLEAIVKERYYKYIQQLTLLKQLSQQELDTQTILTTVKSRYERGQETLENYIRAQVLYTQQGLTRIATEGEVLTAKARLEEYLNLKLEEIILEVK